MKKITGVLSINTANVTLGHAEKLIEYAKGSQIEKILSASSLLITASALQQGINTQMCSFLKNQSVANDERIENQDGFDIYDNGTLFRQVCEFPKIITGGMHEINPEYSKLKIIKKLINRRNELMHNFQPSYVFPITEDCIDEKRGIITLTQEMPPDSWTTVTVKKAIECHIAVSMYLDQIVHCSEDEISKSKFIKMANN